MNLADAMRPLVFDDIVGQPHLTNEESLLRKLVEGKSFDAIMLVGPPGTGKTSMAEIIASVSGLPLYKFHAANSGIADLKKIIADRALYERESLFFIDEIHRYSKSQQDFLLHLIDDKSVKLIGASAENPYFNFIPALRSRALLFNFNSVRNGSLSALFERAVPFICKSQQVDSVSPIELGSSTNVLDIILSACQGDVRRFYNLLEVAYLTGARESVPTAGCDDRRVLHLSAKEFESILQASKFSDDEYYDTLSAFIKSIRGSDPDAALLWCFKLVKNGVSPEMIFRRLMISASEDIGNAYPDGQIFVHSCYESFMNVGIPEGYIILAHAVTFLASVPKSNRSYEAYHKAEKYIDSLGDVTVPANIRHLPKGYKYPFDYGGFIEQTYSPLKETFYKPTNEGFEVNILERLSSLWKSKKDYFSKEEEKKNSGGSDAKLSK